MSDTPIQVSLLEQLQSVERQWRAVVKIAYCHHRNIPYGRIFHEAADRIKELELQLTAANAENTRLRAALSQSDGACVHCSLPKEQWAACKSGFPGCSRADDAMGCPELGARMELDKALARAAKLDLTLATLCDMVLGEDAKDRSDEALLAGVRRLSDRVAELEQWIKEMDQIAPVNESPDRKWHGDIGWLLHGQTAYIGPAKPEGLR